MPIDVKFYLGDLEALSSSPTVPFASTNLRIPLLFNGLDVDGDEFRKALQSIQNFNGRMRWFPKPHEGFYLRKFVGSNNASFDSLAEDADGCL